MTIHDLDTPAVVVDLDVMEANLARMAAFCRDHRLRLRPHTKTHKIPELAHAQVRSGACGITVAKVGEAEVMAAAGLDNILIAYPVVGAQKVERLARLALRRAMTVALDSREAAEGISEGLTARGASVDVLVEINTGFGRCGVTIGPGAIELARYVASLPGLKFRGVMVYPGNMLVDAGQIAPLVQAERTRDAEIVELFNRAGLPIEIFSAGSTPSAPITGELPAVNEIRPGTYIYNDMNTVGSGACTLADCATTALVTIVSTAVPGKAMMDGGSKTFSSDGLRTGKASGYGYIVEDPEAVVAAFNEEHGHLDLRASGRKYRVGERLRVIPNHVCAMVNLHDQVYGVRGETVEVVWNVAGRGKLQ
jgi:D-serine deaminase-like pyridoxal phosphate-dependent protein